ncbi:MAG: MATE family efflux transporter [Lachnospiraceae bacterium]|nr:MATE family efflux transporter [Lachnospiraceae bacterium]
MKKATSDMTVGNPLKLILSFTLPLIAGATFQQLYSVIDTIIVGRLVGVTALAAVGDTFAINLCVVGFVQYTAVGFGVPVANQFGAGNEKELRKYVYNIALLVLSIGIVVCISTVLLSRSMLLMIHTPDNLIDLSHLYIRTCFYAIPVIFIYNSVASILRALGDSRHPLYFLILASVINIVLDLLFIRQFHMGVFGAALATVISQIIAAITSLFYLLTAVPILKLTPEDKHFSSRHCKNLCIAGIPMGLQYSLTSIGILVQQSAINHFGSDAVAAIAGADKIRGFFTLPMESIGATMATFIAQNMGAGKMDRIRQGMRNALVLQIAYAILVGAVLYSFDRQLLLLCIDSSETVVLNLAIRYLNVICFYFSFLGLLFLYRFSLQALGYGSLALFSAVTEIIARCIMSWAAIHYYGFSAICLINASAWIFSSIFNIVTYYIMFRRQSKKIGLQHT